LRGAWAAADVERNLELFGNKDMGWVIVPISRGAAPAPPRLSR